MHILWSEMLLYHLDGFTHIINWISMAMSDGTPIDKQNAPPEMLSGTSSDKSRQAHIIWHTRLKWRRYFVVWFSFNILCWFPKKKSASSYGSHILPQCSSLFFLLCFCRSFRAYVMMGCLARGCAGLTATPALGKKVHTKPQLQRSDRICIIRIGWKQISQDHLYPVELTSREVNSGYLCGFASRQCIAVDRISLRSQVKWARYRAALVKTALPVDTTTWSKIDPIWIITPWWYNRGNELFTMKKQGVLNASTAALVSWFNAPAAKAGADYLVIMMNAARYGSSLMEVADVHGSKRWLKGS